MSLRDLGRILRQDPFKVRFGGGGTVGSQDWMKAVLTGRALGIDFKSIRFIGFEGGGEAIKAIRGKHIDILSGDVAEAQQQIDAGASLRIIAVLAEKRLPGPLANLPTAKEQGHDIQWRSIRGVYVGPKVTDPDYEAWVDAFRKAIASPGFEELLEQHRLAPFALTGAELDSYVTKSMANYRKLAVQFGLRVLKP
jgi:putative tricarboxylic transport membrane protein